MNDRRARKLLFAAAIWIGIIALAGGAYRLFVVPHLRDRAESKKEEALSRTGSSSRFKTTVRVAHDSFSGYCALRSDALEQRLANRGVRLDFRDDGADYESRIRALRDGSVEAAVFTIDALLVASAQIGEFPGTILLVLDETRGADAVVAYTEGASDLDDLNHLDARLVHTASSPSETLARVLHDHFDVSVPVDTWLEPAADVETVFRRLNEADPTARRGYVLWQPFVSRALEIPGVEVLVDTAQLRGTILDVLVVSREWLAGEGRAVARALVEDYLSTAFEIDRESGWVDLVSSDAATSGDALSSEQAENLVAGISWKNTLENYAHFGLLEGAEARGVTHLEDVIRRLASLLVRSGAIPKHPLEGRESWLFHDGVLREMKEARYHPALGQSGDQLGEDAPIRVDATLPSLSDNQWEALLPVGSLRVPPIRFGRGGSKLNRSAMRALEQLAERVESWPTYYISVVGQSRAIGDAEANRVLSEARASAVVEELVRLGVARSRLRGVARAESGSGGAAQSVKFEVGQAPY